MSITSRLGGACRSTRSAIVELRGVPGRTQRLTPDEEPVHPASPMQNAQNAFRTGLWTAQRTRRPQAAQAVSFSLISKTRKTKQRVGRYPTNKEDPETAVMIVAPLR
jgi:hypothetical protein